MKSSLSLAIHSLAVIGLSPLSALAFPAPGSLKSDHGHPHRNGPPGAPSSPHKRAFAPITASDGITATVSAGLGWANPLADNMADFTTTLNGQVRWYYTWSPWSVPSGTKAGLEFSPMLWSAKQLSDWDAQVKNGNWKTLGVTHVLGFNEPNEPGQANMTTAEAIKLWNSKILPMRTAGYKLVSPACSSSPNNIAWYGDFLNGLTPAAMPDALAMHWYGTDADEFIKHVTNLYVLFGLPIWVTEWACHDYSPANVQCTGPQIQAFMRKTLAFVRYSPIVERYAWFGALRDMAGVNQLDSLWATKTVGDHTLSPVGQIYVNASIPSPSSTALTFPVRPQMVVAPYYDAVIKRSVHFRGCYTDAGPMSRTLWNVVLADSASSMTPQLCAQGCFKAGYSLAGVEYASECFCGDWASDSRLTTADACSMPCNGNSALACGNGNVVSVYGIDDYTGQANPGGVYPAGASLPAASVSTSSSSAIQSTSSSSSATVRSSSSTTSPTSSRNTVSSSTATSRPTSSATQISSSSSAVVVTSSSTTVVSSSSPSIISSSATSTASISCPSATTDKSCQNLITACVASNNAWNPWSSSACLAAAFCSTPATVLQHFTCRGLKVPAATSTWIDYSNVYASVVGSCAWQPGSCPITVQNFIDFTYRTLASINSDAYPSSVSTIIDKWYKPVQSWTTKSQGMYYTDLQTYLQTYTSMTAPAVTSAPTCSAISNEAYCTSLMAACEAAFQNGANPWNQASCVASAMCGGSTKIVRDRLTCLGKTVPDLTSISIGYNVYAGIVGSCAWNQGGCPMTDANFLNFIYSTLSNIQSPSWPSDPWIMTTTSWKPIVGWINRGNSVPYMNLLDWFRYKT